jgi:hypothetical protein
VLKGTAPGRKIMVRVFKMVDQENDEKNEATDAARKAVRQVTVTPLDEPPRSGPQKKIHPRRPAPIVPTREERIRRQSNQDKQDKKTESE